MMDNATRWRLEQALASRWPLLTLDRGDLLALLRAYDALLAERDAGREERKPCEQS